MCLHHASPRRVSIHHPGHGEFEPHVVYGHARRRAGFHTSTTEILHLGLAIVGLTTIFSLFFMKADYPIAERSVPVVVLVSALATGTGFLLHELAHKFVAQAYGHWAEFRAQWWGLAIPILIVIWTPLLFAAPGAVIISGWVRKHENGLISAAGPLTNIVIGAIAYPFTTVVGSSGTLQYDVAQMVLVVNAVLGLFNLIPFGILDGRKVLAWSLPVYVLLVLGAVGLLALATGLITLS